MTATMSSSTHGRPLDFTAHGELDRAAVAAWLAELAASLAQTGSMDVEFDHVRYPIDVASQVDLHVDVAADESGTRVGIEITW